MGDQVAVALNLFRNKDNYKVPETLLEQTVTGSGQLVTHSWNALEAKEPPWKLDRRAYFLQPQNRLKIRPRT